ncbi:hypothetical protein DUNSADRAFT_14718 [Dunaliella salina]|uniref:Mitochondrial import inner membrane translocase subunit Tim21 n=1 Tax=Dunaliella salina TaxID=3046 RepID=A0ABQ7H2B8_DUNSA|nr:hypothetical protein DUNSADRAFT_14718 [Dunaliella salina]|eukprot:KAF5841011.1 hypothetical protein DUNSADRAFT_14718 [Dunaliella salina]
MRRLVSPSLLNLGIRGLNCSSGCTSSSLASSRGIHLLARASAVAAPPVGSWPCSSSGSSCVCSPQDPSTSTPAALLQQAAAAVLATHRPFSQSHQSWARSLTTSRPSLQQPKPSDKSKREIYDSLEITPEKIDNAITDKIPERPVGVVEGTSYSLIILAAFAALIFVLYQFVMNFILEPTALQCFNHTLDVLKADPRITVRLGSPDDIRAWGSNSQSRVGRQQIPHQIYKDANNVEHVRIQFYMRGPSGTGLVNADMFKEPTTKSWQYTYLLVDTYTSSSQTPSRVHIVRPQ